MVDAKYWDQMAKGYLIPNTEKNTKVNGQTVNDNKCVGFLHLGKSPGGLFIRVVREFGNNDLTTPLTTPFILCVQSWGHVSHFTLPTTLHRAYHMATRVPCGQASVCHASLISGPSRPPLTSLSRMLDDGPHLRDHLTSPFGSCAHRPVSNHKMRRSMRVEANHA
jgi:hypothetical protein